MTNKNLGQFFTPKNVVNLMVGLISPNSTEILEPASGTGNFVNKLLENKSYNLTAIEYDKAIYNKLSNPIKKITQNISFLEMDASKMFDCIIGNPPYIRWKNLPQNLKEEVLNSKYMKSNFYDTLNDYSSLFIIKSIEHLKEGGELIFITPEYWLSNTQSEKVRKYCLENGFFKTIIKFNETPLFPNVFSSFIIFKFVKSKNKTNNLIEISICNKKTSMTSNDFNSIKKRINTNEIQNYKIKQFTNKSPWLLINENYKSKLEGIFKKHSFYELGDIATISNGMVTGRDKHFSLDNELLDKLNKNEKEALVKVIKAKNINAFVKDDYLQYIFLNNKNITENDLKRDFPNYYNILNQNKTDLLSRYSYGKDINYWDWVFMRSEKIFFNKKPKIFVPGKLRVATNNRLKFCYADSNYVALQDVTSIFIENVDLLYLVLGILNSQIAFEWFYNFGIKKGDIVEFSEKPLSSFPIPNKFYSDKKSDIELIQSIVKFVKDILYKDKKENLNILDTKVTKLYS